MDKKSELATSFHALLEESRRELGEPPSSEELLAYQRGRPSAQKERIQERLAHHPESVERHLDLAAYAGDPGDPDYLSEEDLDRDWAKIRRRVDSEQDADVLPWRTRLGTWQSLAVAASLVSIVLGAWISNLGGQVENLSQTVRELREPRPNVQRLVMQPDGRRRAPGRELPIQLPPEASEYHLILSLVEERSFPDYRLEILETGNADAQLLWSRNGLRRRGDDTFELALSRDYLAPGEYLIRLYGVGERSKELLVEYSVRLGR